MEEGTGGERSTQEKGTAARKAYGLPHSTVTTADDILQHWEPCSRSSPTATSGHSRGKSLLGYHWRARESFSGTSDNEHGTK